MLIALKQAQVSKAHQTRRTLLHICTALPHPHYCIRAMGLVCKQAQASMADRMRRLLSPFILRRLKSEVAGQLMPKVHVLNEVGCSTLSLNPMSLHSPGNRTLPGSELHFSILYLSARSLKLCRLHALLL